MYQSPSQSASDSFRPYISTRFHANQSTSWLKEEDQLTNSVVHREMLPAKLKTHFHLETKICCITATLTEQVLGVLFLIVT